MSGAEVRRVQGQEDIRCARARVHNMCKGKMVEGWKGKRTRVEGCKGIRVRGWYGARARGCEGKIVGVQEQKGIRVRWWGCKSKRA